MGPATPDLSWRKSSYSNESLNNCIEVADGFPNITAVRDSKDPSGLALVFPAESFAAFVGGIKSGLLK